MTRVLGLDVGTKTIGVAVSDEIGLTAQGLETIKVDVYNNNLGFKRLAILVEKYNVNAFVIGLPLNMNGTFGRQAEFCFQYAERLEVKFGLFVHKVDERLTTLQANRVLVAGNVRYSRRKEVVDKMAAVLILQSFLDKR